MDLPEFADRLANTGITKAQQAFERGDSDPVLVLRDLWLLVAGENCGCISCLSTYQELLPRIHKALGLGD